MSAGGTSQVIASTTTGPFAGHQFYQNSSYQTPLPLAASLSMNASGEVAFGTISPPASNGWTGIYKSDGTTVTTISQPISQSNPNGLGNRVGLPVRINDSGTVMFTASRSSDSPPYEKVYTGAGGALTQVSTQTSSVASIGWAMNNAGTVVYRTYNPSTQEYSSVRVTAAGVATTVLGPSMSNLNSDGTQIDNLGRVYTTGNDATGGGVFRWDNGVISKILTGGTQNIAVNGGGQVLTRLEEGGSSSVDYGLYVGENGTYTRVVSSTDMLDGSSVSSLSYGPTSLNDAGQIVFTATLTGGRTALFVATPVPEPLGLLVAGAAVVTLRQLRMRPRRRMMTTPPPAAS